MRTKLPSSSCNGESLFFQFIETKGSNLDTKIIIPKLAPTELDQFRLVHIPLREDLSDLDHCI